MNAIRCSGGRLGIVVACVVGIAGAAGAQPQVLTDFVVFGREKATLRGQVHVVAGAVGSNTSLSIGSRCNLEAPVQVAAGTVKVGGATVVAGDIWYRVLRAASTAQLGPLHGGLTGVVLVPPVQPVPGTGVDITVPKNDSRFLSPGSYKTVTVDAGGALFLRPGTFEIDKLVVKGGSGGNFTSVRCQGSSGGCLVRIRSGARIGADNLGLGLPIRIEFAGTGTMSVGRPSGIVRANIHAPFGTIKLVSSSRRAGTFFGSFTGRQVKVGAGAVMELAGTTSTCGDGVEQWPDEECDGPDAAACEGLCQADCTCPPPVCGNGVREPSTEACDGPDDSACPDRCQPNCTCGPPPGSPAVLHSVGPTVLHNATSFGLQVFGSNFVVGAQLELSDKGTGAILVTLPTTWVSPTEMTALVPAGLPVPNGIERELVAKVINPGAIKSAAPSIGHCATDISSSPTACTTTADCPPGAGACVTGDQRLTLFNDLVFLNPNSAVVVPAPFGVCDDGSPCQGAAACASIGSGACAPKLYVTPQQRDELWVYNTGTRQFVDRAPASGIQGIPVGDNPFHVEVLPAGGPVRAWVVNRFDDSVSIVDPATDTELARVTGAALGVSGRLRMETEIEFNRAGTRAYLSNENVDEIQVLDISGPRRDAPVMVGAIDVGVNPRGMTTNAADSRLYVANVQSADLSVVDIAPGSPTENQVVATIAARGTDDIVGGRADGWEPFVIGGRAPRGVAYSDALDVVFVTSIGPQTGPRQGVVLTGGAIINPTVTVVDALTNTVRAHVAFDIFHRDRSSCSDPELMALDDVRGRLYVTCQGSGTVAVLDTAALSAGLPAELAIVELPLPSDVAVPTLAMPPAVGAFGNKVCGAFTQAAGVACTTDGDCTNCPSLVEGLPVVCCAVNNPVGLHNGPRGLALAADGDTLWVVNQFTTSIATVDVSPADAALASVTGTTSFPGAFGAGTAQRDRRLGQIDFFTDVKKTGVSCATCHIDDHQDGIFFEADVRGPRLRRVLSVRGTRDFLPLLQDQLVPDLLAFTDIVVQAERGGPVPCLPCIEINGVPTCFGAGGCNVTSISENAQNALYTKAITFFPNPNLNADGSLSTAVPLPGGLTGDAVRGAAVFGQLNCQQCHPAPLFTIDQLRSFDSLTLGQPVRMRDTETPVFIPLRAKCQDESRPTGFDGSAGFTVPTLRGVWDTFPLLVSGAAGLGAVGAEPAFGSGCTPGGAGCCAQLQSPLNPSGIAVPPQHLQVTTKDAMRALLSPPLAVPGSGHGAALGLSPSDLDALIAYVRSL